MVSSSQVKSCGYGYYKKNVYYAYLLWETSFSKIENKKYGRGLMRCYYSSASPRAILQQSGSNNEDIRNSESYQRVLCYGFRSNSPKTKGSKKKVYRCNPKLSLMPQGKEVGKGKQKTAELETISEADLTEAEQLKIITKRSARNHISHASGSGASLKNCVAPGVPDAPDYDSEDDISWKSSDDDQADEQDEDDDDHDDDENAQEDDDEHDDDKKDQDDDDEELTESDDDGDDFVHPKLTTHDDEIIHEEDTDEDDSRISSSDEEDSDNEVEGTNVEGAKTQEEATDTEDQGNEASSSVSSGFVSNMLNPNQDTGVDDIFRQNTEATSLIDTNVTAIMEPSFTAQINRPPTPHPIIIQPQQLPILTPATTTSSSLTNSSYFASHVEHYLENKMQEALSVMEAERSLLDTFYGDTVTIKDLEMGGVDDEEPPLGTGRTTVQDLRPQENSASQSAQLGEVMHFQILPSPDHACNSSVPAVSMNLFQPLDLAIGTTGPFSMSRLRITDSTLTSPLLCLKAKCSLYTELLMVQICADEGHLQGVDDWIILSRRVDNAQPRNFDWIYCEGRHYPQFDLRQAYR
ncbi:hypothetical protein Tco_0344224 [Tanacetum coccineum]